MNSNGIAFLLGLQAVPAVVGARTVNPMGADELDREVGNRGAKWERKPERLENLKKGREIGRAVRAAHSADLLKKRTEAIKSAIGSSRGIIASDIAETLRIDARVIRNLLNQMRDAGSVDFRLVPARAGGADVRSWFLTETCDDSQRTA